MNTAPGNWIIVAIGLLAALAQPAHAQRFQSPQDANNSFQMAIRLERAGNFEQSLAIYRQLVQQFPRQNQYYRQLVRLLRQQQQYSQWLAAIREHLEHQPADLQSHIEVGTVYLLLNRPDEAVQAWEGVLVTFAGNPNAEQLVLTRLLNSGFTDKGRQLLKQLRARRNDPTYFAMEIARLYTLRLSHNLAADEYLRLLAAHPSKEKQISHLLLQFPGDDETVAMLRTQLGAQNSIAATRILASLEFKNKAFDRVYELYTGLQLPQEDFYRFSLDLITEEEYDLAEKILTGLIGNPAAEKYHDPSIMALASIHLSRSQAGQKELRLAGLFPGNSLFSHSFLNVPEHRVISLRRALALYDSMAVQRANPTAYFRLAEIKYRILDDFDGAIADLEQVLQNRAARSLFPDVILLLIDAWIAKGDYRVAEEVRQLAQSLLSSKAQLDRVELKATELIFLTGDADSLLAHMGGLMAALGPADLAFNDLLEFSGLVSALAKDQQSYQRFVASEKYLRQNKRSQAIAILRADVQEANGRTGGIIELRLAQLLALQADYSAADQIALNLPDGSQYAELGLLLAAESADYLMVDPELASRRYITFLESFETSVHHDEVRRRFRVLNPDDAQ